MLQIRLQGAPAAVALSKKAVLGSDPGCDVVITDPAARPRHAVISGAGSRFLLMILDTSAPLQVNGERVTQKSIKAGDRIQIGAATLLVEEAGAVPAPAPPAAAPAPAVAPPAAMGPALDVPVALVVKGGAEDGRLYPIATERTTLGRGPGNTIVLPDPYASSKHLEVAREGVIWKVRDLGSTAGTKVNGLKVTEVEVSDGDEILVGRTTLILRVKPGAPFVPGRAAPAAPAPPPRAVPSAPPTAIPVEPLRAEPADAPRAEPAVAPRVEPVVAPRAEPAEALPPAAPLLPPVGRIEEPLPPASPVAGLREDVGAAIPVAAPPVAAPGAPPPRVPPSPTRPGMSARPAAREGPGGAWSLLGLSGEVDGKVFPIAGATVVGSGHDCGLRLPEAEGIGENHARIYESPTGPAIRLLAGAPGLVVNGWKVDLLPLAHGDVIEIAGRKLLFRAAGRPAVPVAVPDDGGSAAAAAAPQVPVTTPVSLVVRGGALDGREFPVGEKTAIGRDPKNDIALPDPTVSARHAEIRKEGDRYVLADVGSTLGSKVNGQRLPQSPLAHGDLIELGQTALVFRDRAKPVPAAPKAHALRAGAAGVRRVGAHETPSPDASALLVVAGPQRGVRYEFRDHLTIGRHEGNNLVVPHPEASNDHARISRRGGTLMLEDLRSTNGTRVNDAPIREVALNHGDVVEIGDTELMLVEPGLPLPSLDRYARPSLILLAEGNKRQARWRLPVTLTIGRNRGHLVQLDDPESSGDHARIQERGGEFFVTDLGSTNGTRLNRKRLTAEVRLRHGDVIAIGATRLAFKEANKSLEVQELRLPHLLAMAGAVAVLGIGVVVIGLVATGAVTGTKGPPNVLTLNPGFDDESGAGWDLKADSPELQKPSRSEDPEAGRRYLRVAVTPTVSPLARFEANYKDEVPLDAGHAYRLLGEVRCSASKGGAACRLQWLLPDKQVEDVWTEWVGGESPWREVSLLTRPPGGARALRVSAVVRGAAGDVGFDNVRLHAIPLSDEAAEKAPKRHRLAAEDRFGSVAVAADPRGMARLERGGAAVLREIGLRVLGAQGHPRLEQALGWTEHMTVSGAFASSEGRALDFPTAGPVHYEVRVRPVPEKGAPEGVSIEWRLDALGGPPEAVAEIVLEGAPGRGRDAWKGRVLAGGGGAETTAVGSDFPTIPGATDLVLGEGPSEIGIRFEPPVRLRGDWLAETAAVRYRATVLPSAVQGGSAAVTVRAGGSDTRKRYADLRGEIAAAEKAEPRNPGAIRAARRRFAERFKWLRGEASEEEGKIRTLEKEGDDAALALEKKAAAFEKECAEARGLSEEQEKRAEDLLREAAEIQRAYGGMAAAEKTLDHQRRVSRARDDANARGKTGIIRRILDQARAAVQSGNHVLARILLESLRNQPDLLAGTKFNEEILRELDALDRERDAPAAAEARRADLERARTAARDLEAGGDVPGALGAWQKFLGRWLDPPGGAGDGTRSPEGVEEAYKEIRRLSLLRRRK
ncbi:MAG: FHA domain-containing protein [Planctomycetales bacterium]|nr:FHA domain-containing protein [Planctomycetales bacterium]